MYFSYLSPATESTSTVLVSFIQFSVRSSVTVQLETSVHVTVTIACGSSVWLLTHKHTSMERYCVTCFPFHRDTSKRYLLLQRQEICAKQLQLCGRNLTFDRPFSILVVYIYDKIYCRTSEKATRLELYEWLGQYECPHNLMSVSTNGKIFYGRLTRSDGLHFIVINPFDTKPMAKIAVKNEHNEGGEVSCPVEIMILRVDQKHHQLLFGGQSVELPLSLHWFPWLPPGGYQRLSMWEIWGKKFTVFWCLKDFDTHWCQRLQE